jgi:hypothetical protein
MTIEIWKKYLYNYGKIYKIKKYKNKLYKPDNILYISDIINLINN